jgi:hypothetical protein
MNAGLGATCVHMELLGANWVISQELPRAKGSFQRGCVDRFMIGSGEKLCRGGSRLSCVCKHACLLFAKKVRRRQLCRPLQYMHVAQSSFWVALLTVCVVQFATGQLQNTCACACPTSPPAPTSYDTTEGGDLGDILAIKLWHEGSGARVALNEGRWCLARVEIENKVRGVR